MTVETHVCRARSRVEAERDAVDAKLEAFEAFVDRVSELSTETAPSPPGVTATGGARLRSDPSPGDRCRAIRTAFDETIRPHSVSGLDDPESLLATIRHEFTDPIAVALAPTTEPSFSPDLEQMVVAEANARQTETELLHRALAREKTRLDGAGDVVDDVTAWIAEADETPLTDLGFAALRQRHETLAGHRERCETRLHRRQEFLGETTTGNVDVGVRHRSLVRYLYRDFPVDHPVLATVARLDSTCAECQRAVRNHLVRRA